jgi:hypothetical protein
MYHAMSIECWLGEVDDVMWWGVGCGVCFLGSKFSGIPKGLLPRVRARVNPEVSPSKYSR